MDAQTFKVRHKLYDKFIEHIEMAADFYSGECVLPGKVEKYIHMKPMGETAPGYKDRIANISYRNDLARIIDANTGAIFANENDANLVWVDDAGNGLGDPNIPGTLAYRLVRDCDGMGSSMETLMKQVARDIQLYPWAWVMVDTEYDGNGILMPVWKILPPASVTNWIDRREFLIKEDTDARSSVFDTSPASKAEQYLHMRVDGYTRYRVIEDKVQVLEERAYTYRDRNQRPTAPIMRVVSPLARQVGLAIAIQCKDLANSESELRFLMRNATFPLMNVHAESTGFQKIIEGLAEGGRAIEAGRDGQGVSFAAPPTAPAEMMQARIEAARKELYNTSFQEFGDAAREKTATEIDMESVSGFGAFITLMRSSIDDAQNFLFDMTAQAQWSSGIGMNNWFKTTITRSSRTLPLNADQVIEQIRTKYFGENALPLGKEAQLAGAKQIADLLGVRIEEADLQSQMDLVEVERIISQYTDNGLDVPAPIVSKLGQIAARILGIPEAEMEADLKDRTEAERAGMAGRNALNQDLQDAQDDDLDPETPDDEEDMTDGEDDA